MFQLRVVLLIVLGLVTAFWVQGIETRTAPEYASPAPTTVISGGGFIVADGATSRAVTGKDSSWLDKITSSTAELATGYVSHAQISISGDAAFTAANGVTGGTGASTNPYIIEGWDISTTTAHGISVQNTNAYFIIRNIRVHSLGSNYNGIYLASANNGAIINVAATGNYRGVLVLMSAGITVRAGNATSNTWTGVEILSSSYATVRGWNVSGNGRDGVRVSQSYLVNVTSNVVSSNRGSGISLSGSDNVTVSVNDVNANNDFAISLYASEYNIIYHNNFAGISPLGSDDLENANSWDGGYPTGGNYWSDYTGSDGNGDGIGDTAYTVDVDRGVQDRYPLMSQYHDSLRDVTVTGMAVSRNFAYTGIAANPIVVDVGVANQGTSSETPTVTAKAGTAIIGSRTVTIAPGASVTVTFNWGANLLAMGNYALTAQVSQLAGETDLGDNDVAAGTFVVRLRGDVNNDCIVNIIDLATVGVSFGKSAGAPGFVAAADLNNDSTVNISDLALVGANFGIAC